MSESSPAPSFSLVCGGAAYQLQRRFGLIPARGLGVPRRAVAFVLFAWAPMTLFALLHRRAFPGDVPEAFFQHFGIHTRCLFAVPLMLAAEAVAERLIPPMVRRFVAACLVEGPELSGFEAALRSAERVRDSGLAFGVLAGLVVLNATLGASVRLHDVSWAVTEVAGRPHLLAGGWWYLLVVRPLASFLLGLWLWRVAVLWVLLRGVAKLDLQLVPTHPDQVGGLGFLKGVPLVFAPVVLALSAVLAAWLGHEMLYHGVRLAEIGWLVGVFVLVVMALFLSPLLAFSPVLLRMRQAALRDYGALVARQGRLVRRRWILGERIEEQDLRIGDHDLLNASEIGPVADALTLYDAVTAVRPVPLSQQTALVLAVAALLPMIPVVALEVPLKDVLLKLATAIL